MVFAGRQKNFQITEVYSLTKKRRTNELAINPTVQELLQLRLDSQEP